MNKKVGFLIGTAAFVVLIAVASLLYSWLGDRYQPSGEPHVHENRNGGTEQGGTPDKSEPAIAFADFTVTDREGHAVSLSEMAGKPVVINYWATWCNYCVAELPAFEEQYQTYGDEVIFMMVNVEGYGGAESYIEAYCDENGYTFPVYFDVDDNAAAAYGAYSIPLTVFIDKDGNVTDRHLGRMSSATLGQYIEACKRSESLK